jgi:uncharacterized membrane protein
MIVLVVLIAATLIARLIGVAGVEFVDSWPAATRVGLAAMLLLTASAHFTPMRHELARMVPPGVPRPMAMIYFTGVCELAGAVGLLIPVLRVAAAWSLIVFFIAVLPANVYAARSGQTLGGKPVTPLVIRVPMQVLFIGLTWWAGIANAT